MRKILFFMLSLFLLGCTDPQVKDFGKKEEVVFEQQVKESAVWRVKLHPLGSYTQSYSGIIAIALEDGKRFRIEYDAFDDATKDWLLLEAGDTVVYKQAGPDSKIIAVKFKQ